MAPIAKEYSFAKLIYQTCERNIPLFFANTSNTTQNTQRLTQTYICAIWLQNRQMSSA